MQISRGDIKTLAVLAAVFAVFAVGLWLPASFTRSDIQERITAARTELNNQKYSAKDLANLNRNVLELRASVQGTQRYIPEEDELDELLRSLAESLQGFDVRQQEIETSRMEYHADYTVVPVSVRFEGSFPTTFGILSQIESMPRLLRIERMELQPQRQDRIGEALLVSLEINTFFAETKAVAR